MNIKATTRVEREIKTLSVRNKFERTRVIEHKRQYNILGIEPKAPVFKEVNDYKNSASRLKGGAIPRGGTKDNNII